MESTVCISCFPYCIIATSSMVPCICPQSCSNNRVMMWKLTGNIITIVRPVENERERCNTNIIHSPTFSIIYQELRTAEQTTETPPAFSSVGWCRRNSSLTRLRYNSGNIYTCIYHAVEHKIKCHYFKNTNKYMFILKNHLNVAIGPRIKKINRLCRASVYGSV